MPDKDIFGLEISPSEDVETFEEPTEAPLEVEETPSEESPVEGQPRDERGRFAPQAASEEDPAAEEPEPETPAEITEDVPGAVETGEAVEGEESAEEVEQRLYANKFADVDALERGYNESRDMWRRANEARKAEAQRAMELQEQYAALYRQMEQAVPVLQQAAQREQAYRSFAEQYKAQYGEYPQGYTPPAPQPAPGPQDVQSIVDQRLAEERSRWAAAMEEQQQYEALSGAVSGFYQEHPDLQPEYGQEFGPADHQIADALTELNQAWDRHGIEVDPSDRGSLEIAYEASKDSALLEVLKLNPQYFESEYGMELARRDAAVISGRVPATTAPQTARVPASKVKSSGAKKPFVESAASGADAPNTEDQSDPWVRIKNSSLEGGPTTPGQRKSVFFE